VAKRGASSLHRITLNRAVLDEITLATADGLFEMAKVIVENAAAAAPRTEEEPQDPSGLYLYESGGAVAYVRGKKVADTTVNGSPIKAPRGARVTQKGAIAMGGFTVPARWVELGSVHNAAAPFLTPALLSEQPDAGVYVKEAMDRRLPRGPK